VPNPAATGRFFLVKNSGVGHGTFIHLLTGGMFPDDPKGFGGGLASCPAPVGAREFPSKAMSFPSTGR
jgi:hypothetical protein